MNRLRDALERYITMRRGFGYKMRCQALLLARFVTYMEHQGATIITTKLALDPTWTVAAERMPNAAG
jgi:hypothetical protein